MNNKLCPTRLQNPPGSPFFSETPRVVGVEITGRCQLRCRHCFNRSGPGNPHELSLTVVDKLLDEMQIWDVNHLRISGGEPTCHCQFQEIVAACQERGISIALNTHGVYSGIMLEYLKTAPIDLFLISVDGLEANNDAIRGKGVFRRAVHSCKKLHWAGQRVMIGFHIGRVNRADVRGLITLAAEIGVDIKLSPIRPLGRVIEELPNVVIPSRSYLEVVIEVNELRHKFPHIKIVSDFDILNNAPDKAVQCDQNLASCTAGRTMVNINYDGGIYPCAFFVTQKGEFCAGNIYHDSVTEVWKNSPIFQPFRIHQKSDACQHCIYYQSKCAGGCPAVTHFMTGYLDSRDPMCFAHLVDSPNSFNAVEGNGF